MSSEIVEAVAVPTVQIHRNERIAAMNAGARALFGDMAEGRHYITVLRQPVLLDAVERTLRDGQRTEALYLTTEARRDVTLKATCSPIGTSGEVLVCFEDRTEMEAAGLMRRDFVANVSHELRTPLTALMGFIDTLKGPARDDPAARHRFLDIMQREASRMNRLVGDLLSLSRVEASERMRPTAAVDVAAITRTVLGTLAPLAAEQGVTLRTLGLETEATLSGDADQLSQVVTNLVENAIKYSGQGTTVEVALSQEDRDPAIRDAATVLTVTDNGPGFDPVHIPRLTERFYRIDDHRSREKGGTGLGLAIVKHIVNRHRGRLRIESAEGKGSRFSVILPRSHGNMRQS